MTGKEVLFINSKVSLSRNSQCQWYLNQAKGCCLSTASRHATSTHSKLPYNVCTQAYPKIVLQSSSNI